MDLSSESERRSLPPHVTYRDHQARLRIAPGVTVGAHARQFHRPQDCTWCPHRPQRFRRLRRDAVLEAEHRGTAVHLAARGREVVAAEAGLVTACSGDIPHTTTFDADGRVGSDLAAPSDQPRRLPSLMGAMGSLHVRGIGGVSAFLVDAEVRRDPAMLVEDLDRRSAEADIDLPAQMRMRNAVQAAVRLDVVVDVDPGLAPLRVLVAPGGKRPQRRTVQIVEPGAAAAFRLVERPLVQCGQCSGAMVSRSSPREKNVWLRSGAMIQRSTFWTAASTFALSLRRVGPRRQHGGSVVRGQFLVRGVQVRLVAAGPADRSVSLSGTPFTLSVGCSSGHHPKLRPMLKSRGSTSS